MLGVSNAIGVVRRASVLASGKYPNERAMLTGFLLMGLMAAVVTPIMMGDNDDGAVVDEVPDAETDTMTEDTNRTEDEDAMQTEPMTYEMTAMSGEQLLEGFRPGTDRITIQLDSWELDLAEEIGGANGPALHFGPAGDDATVLRFPGLDAIPSADIHLVVTEPGMEPVSITLAEAGTSGAGDTDVLDPVDPDAPDVDTGPGLSGDAVSPTDPDAIDAPPTDAVGDDPLEPVLDDEILPQSLEAGGQIVYLASPSWGEASDPMIAEDFTPGEDVIYITVDVVPGSEPPVLEVEPSEDGNDGLVRVNGQAVAILRGAPEATTDDVVLVTRGLDAA